ncbi:MAG: SNF2-related protein [Pseudomonadota bacterium]
MSWYKDLINIKSLGSIAPRPGSLAGLHEVRKISLSQFFTPQNVVDFIWSIVGAANVPEDRKISILDSGCGVGSMFWPAVPEKHTILGCDVHSDSVNALSLALNNAGFGYDLLNCGMEDLRFSGDKVDLLILNPPFGIHLESPNLEPEYVSTCYGMYGPNTSAMSHNYALDQALDVSDNVIALLPRTHVDNLNAGASARLVAIYDLPSNTFLEQGANVRTSICVFGKQGDEYSRENLGSDMLASKLPCLEFSSHCWNPPQIHQKGIDFSTPTINIPVTNDKTVHVGHNGRKIILGFKCGLVQARVINAILEKKAVSKDPKKRLSKHVVFSGQGKLDIQLHLLQKDPIKSLQNNLFDIINSNGGIAVVDIGLINYVKKQIKRIARAKIPFGHCIYKPGDSLSGGLFKAKKDVLINEDSIISPVVDKGVTINVKEKNGDFICIYNDIEYQLSEDFLYKNFDKMEASVAGGWITKFKPKSHWMPELYHEADIRAKKLKLNLWLYDYQYQDVIEATINPCGAILGHDMGLGKTRISLAALLLSNVKHGLIVVMSKLVYEFKRQIENDLSDFINIDDVNFIEKKEDLDNLKQINIISYSRLSCLPDKNKPKQRFTYFMRRRFGLVIADEAHLLSNSHTLQSRAIKSLSPKKFLAMTGTPIANFPRNIHPLLIATAGDGTFINPYGLYNGRILPEHIFSMDTAFTGPQVFIDSFVTLQWVTHEFEGNLVTGAKREIPRLKSVNKYRQMVSHILKRRVTKEPEVAVYLDLPEPTHKKIFLIWDEGHLKHYLNVARSFADIWKDHFKKLNGGEVSSLAAILPKINAVIKANNRPFVDDKYIRSYVPLTSKDRYCVKRIQQWVNEGKKMIVFFNSPDNVDRIEDLLNAQGIESVNYTGRKSASKRACELELKIKKGNVQVLLATKASLSEGENIEVCSRVLFYDVGFVSKTERQCYSRVLRTGQKNDVYIEYMHLQGSIDEYQRQMCDFKKESSDMGLDYADPRLSNTKFLHMETILHSFVEGLEDLESQINLDKAA